MIYSAEKR